MDNECYSVSASPVTTNPRPAKPKPNKPKAKAKDSSVKSTADNAKPQGAFTRSIFHEPWWLEAVTDGRWGVAEVRQNDEVIGEMPYTLERKGIWRISALPPMTRTLGPVIKPQKSGGAEREWCYRMDITNQLIAKLPPTAHFHQLMDTRMSEAEAIAFTLHGYDVSVGYTMEIPAERTESEAWSGLRRNTRNWVRRASEQLTIREIDSPDAFTRFYDGNLAVRKRSNVYGSNIMRRLLGEVLQHDSGVLLGAFDDKGALMAETALVWDDRALYYLLSSRLTEAHGGAVSLLIWEAARVARERKLLFDLDGISTASILDFLSGFGGRLVTRYEIEKVRADFGALRTVLRGEKTATKTGAKRLRKFSPEKA
ncbi:GNAT family N-acetyltransferase [Caballeronia sp. LZ062]|uniref:GNAT family N-acetyltransferase n=1 Tax=unclassified Caballeronia TaxID=2646786 RepID=UPI00285CDEA6|nr:MULTISPECIES: GNAT family N-acetyltransferase [unclassified Caballeronia]MDR5856397.1 GNAT family N-acetyltransferase [Caballeronia sp. LZ050]MDR5873067.1 GNAT family N-acetyltransferase [Caballeronia sp. LZ062]